MDGPSKDVVAFKNMVVLLPAKLATDKVRLSIGHLGAVLSSSPSVTQPCRKYMK